MWLLKPAASIDDTTSRFAAGRIYSEPARAATIGTTAQTTLPPTIRKTVTRGSSPKFVVIPRTSPQKHVTQLLAGSSKTIRIRPHTGIPLAGAVTRSNDGLETR